MNESFSRADADAVEGAATLRTEHAQVSLAEADDGSLYFFNWVADPQDRGQGHARDVLRLLCWIADHAQQEIVTHPDDAALVTTFARYGFEVDTEAEPWEHRPLVRRRIQAEPGPCPVSVEFSWDGPGVD